MKYLSLLILLCVACTTVHYNQCEFDKDGKPKVCKPYVPHHNNSKWN